MVQGARRKGGYVINKHGRMAWEYWRTYRPNALAELGGSEEQERFFNALGLRVLERIGDLSDDLLEQVPAQQRALQRTAVRQQAVEVVYEEEIYLPKEPGTEHREL